MKRFFAICIAFLLVMKSIVVHAEEIEEPTNLYAQSAVLMDADSGRILFEKNGQEIMAMASTTKIMTCILALEEGDLNAIVSASENATAQPKVHLNMQQGEQFYLRDLLYSLMLESHNDSAVAIAEYMAGSVESFAAKMNKKAKEIGCKDTYFITPNGLDATDEKGFHSTTATELARIMSYCIMDSPKKEEFLKITSVENHSFSNVEGTRIFSCNNKNSFLTMMEGAISGKTGFTGKAGYCYVGVVRREKRTFVVALLACGWPNNKNYKWKDTQKLMEYAIDNYTYQNVYEEPEFPLIEVENGIPKSGSIFENGNVNLQIDAGDEEKFWVLLRNDEKVEVKYDIPKQLEAPARQEEIVGNASYYLDGVKILECPIVAGESVEEKNVSWYLWHVAKAFFCMSGF